jgi:hypothetical protein
MKERFDIELVLGMLVGLLSVVTAYSAYLLSLADANAGGLEVAAIKALTESNTEFLRSNQEVMLDYAAFDNYVVAGRDDEELAEFYLGGFSPILEAGMERPDGPFDDFYYEETFFEADALYQEALDLFDQSQDAGDMANQLQLIMLVLAVGLSLSAFASLGKRQGRLAKLFISIAALTLVYGLIRLVTVS